jgi:hypothetical protein
MYQRAQYAGSVRVIGSLTVELWADTIQAMAASKQAGAEIDIAWMFDGIPEDVQPGLQLYPAHLARKIAEL